MDSPHESGVRAPVPAAVMRVGFGVVDHSAGMARHRHGPCSPTAHHSAAIHLACVDFP